MERELLLLGILRQQDMHGYQITEFINRDLAYCTDLKKPTAYFLLKKMAEGGLIAEEIAQEGGRPARHVYRLTEAGEAEFQRLLRENLAGHASATFADDIGLAFLDTLDPAEGRALLETRRAAVEARLAEVRAVPRHGGSIQLMIDHQARFLEAEQAWLSEVIAGLAETGRA